MVRALRGVSASHLFTAETPRSVLVSVRPLEALGSSRLWPLGTGVSADILVPSRGVAEEKPRLSSMLLGSPWGPWGVDGRQARELDSRAY